jgi:D-alanine-D-alanine ligase
MKIAIAHNAVDQTSAPDERDVLVQAEIVSDALAKLGHESFLLPCDMDLAGLQHKLRNMQPDLVFNLVESLDGKGRLIGVVPFMLDAMGIAFTGAPAESIHVTSHKGMAKEKMLTAGLPTPPWIGPWPHEYCSAYEVKTHPPNQFPEGTGNMKWIIKSAWEHASLGISGDGLVAASNPAELITVLPQRADQLGGACFAELFIDGREFNLSVLAGPDGPEVLPPVEILFEGYDENQPRIVCYSAKWDETSFEYSHTPRRFDFPEDDKPLLNTLIKKALRCWHVFDLRGYARVDFRVDAQGRPWILEINANPCLSPDAGFAAALDRANIPFAKAVERVLDTALQKNRTISAIADMPSAIADDSWGKNTEPGTVKRPESLPDAVFRYEARPQDVEVVRSMTAATGFFHSYEIDVAIELVEDRLEKGTSSDYSFVFLEKDSRLIGYACYGLIPCTESSYDIYWIVVHPDFKRQGIGRIILTETERLIGKAGGRRIYIDTSQSEKYLSTHAFYQQCGYVIESILKDFYAPGDGKVIFCKIF